jgi:hypothetical protein
MGTMIHHDNCVGMLQAQDGAGVKGNAWADEQEMRKLASEALKSMNSFSVSRMLQRKLEASRPFDQGEAFYCFFAFLGFQLVCLFFGLFGLWGGGVTSRFAIHICELGTC